MLCWFCGTEEDTVSEEVVTHYLKPEGSNKKFIWTYSNCLCFHLFTQDPFPIIYWLCVKSFTASLISFDPFSCNKSLFRSVDVLKSLKLIWGRCGWNIHYFGLLGFSDFCLECKENQNEAYAEVFSDVKPFQICVFPLFIVPTSVYEGEEWDHYTVTVWCASQLCAISHWQGI